MYKYLDLCFHENVFIVKPRQTDFITREIFERENYVDRNIWDYI